LTTLFDDAALDNAAIASTILPANHAAPKKHNLLPVLIVLFLISYGLMTLLIVEQGRTIESQRTMIHELLHDSAELAAVRSRTLQESAAVGQQQQAQMQVPQMTPSAKTPSTQIQTPSTQTPSTQVQSNHVQSNQVQSSQIPPVHTQSAPSAQVTPHSRVQHHQKAAQPEFQVPTRPASDLADDRRAVKTI
jgi:FtsZ-interacting cell division protein ZipA